MDIEPFGQPPGLGGFEGGVERSDLVGVEVVHHETHFHGVRIARIEHAFDEVREVNAGAPFGDFHMPLAGQRFHGDKNIRHTVSDIFVIDDLAVTGRHGDGLMHLFDQLFVRLVHANNGIICVVREFVDRKHILHVGDEGGVGIGWDLPIFAQVRTQFVFFRER